MDLKKLKQIIEAVLMASGEVLSIERIQLLFDEYEKPKSPVIKQALESLMEDFSDRGIELVEVASGYRLQVRKEVAPWVTRLWDEKPQRYSRALLETMSLIAYRQPITRGDIEDVRGVAVSSQIIRTLLDREWVRVVGHRDVPGRPAMYATTKEFLDYFSLKSLDELPNLDEIREMDDANQSLDLINSEKQASATREYDFASEDEVSARGEEILAETELELEEAAKLVQQVEDNVFNKPSEEELAAEREAERQAISAAALAEEERLAEEAAREASLLQPSFKDMANKAEQRLTSDEGRSGVELSDRIADHQARLAGINTEQADVITEQPDEELSLLQQQEQLMQRLMQEESQRQTQQVVQGVNEEQDVSEDKGISDEPNAEGFDSESLTEEGIEAEDEDAIEAELLAEAEAEKELLEQESAAERELLEQEAFERDQLEKELLEKERLAEEALEMDAQKNELGLDDGGSSNSASSISTNIKKNSLFDD